MRQSQAKPDRRQMLAGAGTAAALATAALVLKTPHRGAPAPEAATNAEPDAPAGYRVTDHVMRYYRTARV